MREAETEEEEDPPVPRLETLLLTPESIPWLKEWRKDTEDSAWAAWNGSTAQQRVLVGRWIRGWDDADCAEQLKAVVSCLNPMINACFVSSCKPWLRRWVAEVVFDVLGESLDVAETVEMAEPPQFSSDDSELAQFRRFEIFDDLWEPSEEEPSRAEDLLEHLAAEAEVGGIPFEKVHEVLCRWVVASTIAELARSFIASIPVEEEQVSARESLLARARAMRPDDEDSDEDNDFSSEDESDWTTRQPLPLPPTGARTKTEVGAFYAESSADVTTRHASGYDALDIAVKKDNEDETEKERKARLRLLLVEHVDAMAARGLVVEASFPEASLGLSVCLSKYGAEGRAFVMVESTQPHCFNAIKPGDELVSVNGAYVVDPSEASIVTLLSFVESAPRPVKAVFVKGEDREKLAAEQSLTPTVKKKPITTPKQKFTPSMLASKPPGDAVLIFFDGSGEYAGYVGGDGRLRTPRRRTLGFVHNETWTASDSKERFIGRANGDDDVVALRDAADEIVAYVDLGRARVLDVNRNTVLEISRTGECRGFDSMPVGTLQKFSYDQMRLVALVYVFIAPKIFDAKPKSALRRIRKSGASLTGARGFFA